MTIKVQRAAAPRIARHGGLYTLSQSFRFSGLNSHDIATTILTKLLVGEESLFGNRPGTEVAAPEGERHLRDFSPTPDGHRLPPLRDLIAAHDPAHDPTTRKSDFLLNIT